jgi:N-[(2S)-2-amino-2-carboxyethyl]-L-glutamate dehydrogenase
MVRMMPRVRGAGDDIGFLFLSQEDVVAAGGTDMAAIVEVIEAAFRIKAEGWVFMPPKVMITWSDEPGTEELHGRIMAMPAYVGGAVDVAGLKWIPSVPDNPAKRGLPRANALVVLSDRETGLPLAVMDGTVVSAMRTGAVTGVAVRYLANRSDDVACLLGAGVLAHTQLDALRVVMPALRQVRVFDPAGDRLRRFCEQQTAATGLDVIPASDAESAVRGAQVIVPATMAVEPTFQPDWLETGATVVLVSSLDGPESLHAATDLLVVDDWVHESTHQGRYAYRLVEAGIIPADGSRAVELAEVVAGRHPGRTDPAQRIVVSPVGLAMDDVATAAHVFASAREQGLGTSLRLRRGPPVWE